MFWSNKGKISEKEREVLLGEVPCIYCGGWHDAECLRTKHIWLDANSGKIHEVEFWDEWDKSTTIFRHQLEDDDAGVPLRRKLREVMSRRSKRMVNKAQDVLWSAGYIAWASRVAVFAITTALTLLLVVGLFALVVHALGWLSFR